MNANYYIQYYAEENKKLKQELAEKNKKFIELVEQYFNSEPSNNEEVLEKITLERMIKQMLKGEKS